MQQNVPIPSLYLATIWQALSPVHTGKMQMLLHVGMPCLQLTLEIANGAYVVPEDSHRHDPVAAIELCANWAMNPCHFSLLPEGPAPVIVSTHPYEVSSKQRPAVRNEACAPSLCRKHCHPGRLLATSFCGYRGNSAARRPQQLHLDWR